MRLSKKQKALGDIEARIKEARLPLSHTAQNLVFGKGNLDAPIFFIGEAPGAKEDEQGIPFVGAAGKQLDRLLSSIGLSLEEVYIANILKYRPPNNRPPKNDEIKAHTPFLVEQIEVINPKVIVPLGNFATKFVLAKFDCEGMSAIDGITKLHGKEVPLMIQKSTFKVFPLFHPAAMLYNPRLRTILAEDFQTLKIAINP
jgi:uracil-DNA glycosylase family 4